MFTPSLKEFLISSSVLMMSVASANAGASSPAAPDIDLIKIDETITLRHMVAGPSSPKGTVLFLHGFPETLTVWKTIAETLGKDYEVHAFDWPGYGQSSRPSAEQFSYSPKDYAKVLKAYIEKTEVDRSKLVIYASDIGGLPALLLALEEPTVARKIIVGDFAPFNRPEYMYESLQNLKAEPKATPTRAYMNKTSDEILQNVHRRGLAPEAQYELSAKVQEDMKAFWERDGVTSADAFALYYSHFTRDERLSGSQYSTAENAGENHLGRTRHLHQARDGQGVRRAYRCRVRASHRNRPFPASAGSGPDDRRGARGFFQIGPAIQFSSRKGGAFASTTGTPCACARRL